MPGGAPAFLDRAGRYILMSALLLGVLWSGGYFPVPKWTLAWLLLLAGSWELAMAVFFGHREVLRSPALWLFTVFAVLALASRSWTLAPGQTGREAVLVTGYLSALFVARRQIIRSGCQAAGSLLNWLVYSAVFVAAWGIITYLLRVYPYVTFVDLFLRAGSTFEYSNALSCFELMALPVTLALYLKSNRKEKPLFASAAALEIAAVALAFSRLGLVLLTAELIYFLVAARRRGVLMETMLVLVTGFLMAITALVLGEAEHGKTGVAIDAVLAGLLFLGQSYAGTPGSRPLISRGALPVVVLGAAAALIALSGRAQLIITRRFGEGFSFGRLLPHRQETWAAAYQAFRDRPVKGWGLGAMPEIFSRYQIAQFTKFAHNVVLQMAVDTGIIGAALFSLFLGYAAVLSLRRLLWKPDQAARALAIATLAFIVYNMFDWEWFIPAITTWFMVLLACLEAIGTGVSSKHQRAERQAFILSRLGVINPWSDRSRR